MPSPLDHAEQFVVLTEHTTNDAFGQTATWTKDEAFPCLLWMDQNAQKLLAEQPSAVSLFRAICEKDAPVAFYTVLQRVRDGAVFRVSSHPEDHEAPEAASFSVKAFTAHRYDLPKEAVMHD